MLSPFRAGHNGSVVAAFADVDVAVLGDLLEQLVEMLGAEEAPSDDPLEALVGTLGTSTVRPSDPALARLLPDAYADDEEAAADFRRYTEPALRATKRTAARTALSTLVADGARVLSEDEAQAWLRALNDLRLTLGTRLGVTDDDSGETADDADDPRGYAYAVYDYLSWLQETLLRVLAP